MHYKNLNSYYHNKVFDNQLSYYEAHLDSRPDCWNDENYQDALAGNSDQESEVEL